MNRAIFVSVMAIILLAPSAIASHEGDGLSGAMAFSTPIAALYMMVLVAAIAGTAIFVGRR